MNGCIPAEWACIPPAMAENVQIQRALFVGNRFISDADYNKLQLKITLTSEGDQVPPPAIGSRSLRKICLNGKCILYLRSNATDLSISMAFDTKLYDRNAIPVSAYPYYEIVLEAKNKSKINQALSQIRIPVGNTKLSLQQVEIESEAVKQ